jgi:CRISPR-associated protein Cmr4
MTIHLTFVHALSPLHAGTGQGAGTIDLPIAREKATNLPFLPGSSLKGALRNQFGDNEKAIREKIFGRDMSESEQNDSYASAVQISDQRLLLFPVRSLAGTYAWVTSPYVLRRLLRDIKETQARRPQTDDIPTIQTIGNCTVTSEQSALIIKGEKSNKLVYLEDLDLTVDSTNNHYQDTKQWAEWLGKQIFPNDKTWQTMLVDRFCIVHDDIFNFLLETATEIITRIKIKNDTKTVEDGGLWYEEALPTETVLSGLLQVTQTKINAPLLSPAQVLGHLQEKTNQMLQLGGKATVGRGMCQVQFSPPPSGNTQLQQNRRA